MTSAVDGRAGTFVQHHRDIRAQIGLDLNGALGRQEIRGAVEMGAELDAVLIYLPALGEAEHLVAAAVGEDGLVPANEPVQAAAASDQLVARPQHQVIGVAKDDARADLFKMLSSQGFYRALGAHGHEDRRLDRPMRGL